MVEYLDGGRIQGISTLTTAPPQTSWKEIARTTLSSASDTITVNNIPTRDNLMIIPYVYDEGSNQVYGQGRFNNDSGNNYANRWSRNGGSDSTNTSQSEMITYFAGSAYGEFGVFEMANIANQEKLLIDQGVGADATGACTAPKRHEGVHKWANTSNQVTRFDYINGGGGTFGTGSEVVVLGYNDDEADSGTNFWQELANVTVTSGTTISSGTFTAKKYLMFDLYFNASGSGGQPKLQVGNSSVDTGSNYATRRSSNGSEDTLTSQDVIYPYTGGQNTSWYVKGFIINKSDKEKLFIMECNEQTTAGAGNAPTRCETVAKWTNTSNQINIMKFTSHNSIAIGNAKLTVWGAD